ncbi:MAG: TetR/AcrR family transcriptional regulator [Clostridia bacterium]
MNIIVTSKSDLIKKANLLIDEQGFASLNIRDLANYVGCSVGTIYNYFSSKSDLVFSIVEDFWKNNFHSNIAENLHCDFLTFISNFYSSVFDKFTYFRQNLLPMMSILNDEEKAKGKNIEAEYKRHMLKHFIFVLQNDTLAPASIWTENFTKTNFCNFVLENIIFSIYNNNYDFAILKEIITKIFSSAK